MAGTLFEKYGGFANVSKIVMAFYDKAIDSDIIGPYFEDTDMRRLVDHQTKFIAQVMGGPVSYSGDALRRVHAPLNIDRAAFDEMAALLRETLEDFSLASGDVDTVMDQIMARAGEVISTGKT
jgi:hemoglobin